MILYQIPLLIFAMGLVYIFIAPSEPFIFSLFFKLAPMILIFVYAFKQLPLKKSNTHWLIIIGLIFCIIGDGTIHWFPIGLSAFLIGNLFYIAGFLTQWNFSKIRLVLLVPIAICGIFIGRVLIHELNSNGNEALMVPVIGYLLVISLMAWSAIMTGNRWASSGGILFVLSYSLLVWNMFIAPVGNAAELIMLSYYGAQFLIIHSLATIVEGSNRIVW
ncbi:lysoplasmalogenase [Oceanobacillus damuensis]|uniref:lysoplasmalogenase n=1 Tax=Oceanobacillus damuensis TaxID=937928 RepID=UPI000836E019|nr:lysoplasmalogenase [Oceanobacillus damuensis]